MFTYLFGRDFSVAISRLMLISFVAVLPFMGGCGEDDNPIVDDDHDHEADAPLHADADGFVLEVEEVEVYRQLRGDHNGGLTVGAGEEIDVHVVFLDANGAEVHLDEVEGAELYTLGLSDYDSAVIDIHQAEGEAEAEAEPDGHAHGEELGFEVVGLKAGTTEIKLQLLHGDHPDFTAALLIPVTVE